MRMLYLDSNITGRVARSVAALLVGAAVASCGTPAGRAVPVQETSPSVTYTFTDDQGLIDATFQAEVYCREFNSWPTSTGVHTASDGSRVTFVCDQARTAAFTGAQPPPIPPNPTVSYTYRNERGLIDATTQEQQHCTGFSAQAHSTSITTGADGSRTVVFECVRI